MASVSAFLYDKYMARVENASLKKWREELFAGVKGDVLEIGAGTGASIDFYPSGDIRLIMAEPDEGMRNRLKQRLARSGRTTFSVAAGSAENIDAADESFDFVISSLVCCSVMDVGKALQEIKRVLKPGGRFIFIEHVAAEKGSAKRKWQERFNPLWVKVARNCHLNRETEQAISAAGFRIEEIKNDTMRSSNPLVRPAIRGVAVKC